MVAKILRHIARVKLLSHIPQFRARQNGQAAPHLLIDRPAGPETGIPQPFSVERYGFRDVIGQGG